MSEKSILDLAAEFHEETYAAAIESSTGHVPSCPGSGNFKRPIHSEALAVHPRQIPEAIEVAKKKGVPVEFDRQGRPIFHSSRQFREYAKKHGFRHKGY